MFKLLFVGALVYLLYRVVMQPYLDGPTYKNPDIEKPEDDDYVDYEEIE